MEIAGQHVAIPRTLSTSYVGAQQTPVLTTEGVQWNTGDSSSGQNGHSRWRPPNAGVRSTGLGSTGKGILIGMLSAFGSAALVAIVLLAVYFFRYTIRGRIFLDRIGRPGEYDDEQAFLREEEEALAEMDDLQRTEYLRAKGTTKRYGRVGVFTANASSAFVQANPPESMQTDISLSQFLAIQEKGVSAWEFEPELEIANCFVEGRTEIEFFDSECSVQSNLPVPKQNEVYYWEAKIYDKPESTLISIGMSTKPYPLFRLPGTLEALTHETCKADNCRLAQVLSRIHIYRATEVQSAILRYELCAHIRTGGCGRCGLQTSYRYSLLHTKRQETGRRRARLEDSELLPDGRRKRTLQHSRQLRTDGLRLHRGQCQKMGSCSYDRQSCSSTAVWKRTGQHPARRWRARCSRGSRVHRRNARPSTQQLNPSRTPTPKPRPSTLTHRYLASTAQLERLTRRRRWGRHEYSRRRPWNQSWHAAGPGRCATARIRKPVRRVRSAADPACQHAVGIQIAAGTRAAHSELRRIGGRLGAERREHSIMMNLLFSFFSFVKCGVADGVVSFSLKRDGDVHDRL